MVLASASADQEVSDSSAQVQSHWAQCRDLWVPGPANYFALVPGLLVLFNRDHTLKMKVSKPRLKPMKSERICC